MRLARAPRRDDSGFSIIELMVVVLLLSLLMSVFYTFLFGGERAARDGREWLELNESARLALERLSRELREADSLEIALENKVRFGVDFNANGVIEASGNEILVYEFDDPNDQLLVSTDLLTSEPLARNVVSFRFLYYGSDPYLDANHDGAVTSTEIDTNGNGLIGPELNRVSSVVMEMTVGLKRQRHAYSTGVELRNIFK